MSGQEDPIKQAMERIGREAGFERKSRAWYRQADEVTSVTHLQKEDASQHYINQGFWLRQLGDERFPMINDCHVYGRIENLVPDIRVRIRELLNLNYEMADQDRADELVTLLQGVLVPLIDRGSSIVGLRAMLEDGTLVGVGVTGAAQPILASPID